MRRPSQRAGRGWEALPEGQKGLRVPPGGLRGVGRPPGGPGGVGKPFQKAGRGQEGSGFPSEGPG